MARFSECQDTFPRYALGEEDDDWGSDFEEELPSQEIEDNKINEIREANFLKNTPSNVQNLTDDNSQTIQTLSGNNIISATKTGAIPKLGFSYLNNTVITDAHRAVQTTGTESENNIHPQRQVSKPASQSSSSSMNLENFERQTQTQLQSNNDAVTKKTPSKLKPEAFSFLNKLPQRKVTESGNDIGKDRKILAPTAFSQAGRLDLSQSQDDTIMKIDESSDEFVEVIPSAPSLQDTSNYEPISEDPVSELDLLPFSCTEAKENVKPPLPSRPPPIFKYAPETFSSSRSASIESTSNLVISHPFSQSPPVYPKLSHSISSPDTGLKHSSEVKPNRILNSKERNRRSLPSAPVCPAIPKRPLPPLPISDTKNLNRIKPQDGTDKLENRASVSDESWLEGMSTVHSTTLSHQTNQFSIGEVPIQHTDVKDSVLKEQLISNPQHRLAQILTNQTSVDSKVLFSQHKIASAINSRATKSQSNSVLSRNKSEESELQNGGKPEEIRETPGRPSENGTEQLNEDKFKRLPSYLEAREVQPRRFPDHEALINAMSRPALPQKAAPIQRSVSCNSLVQSIKDLSFSVWSKPEKKRNSDGISISKKNPKSISAASSSKVKCTAPLTIALIPKDAQREVINPHQGNRDGSPTVKETSLHDYPWFHDVDAKEGQLRLRSVGQDGTFLIRPSSRPTDDIQNTLCILYNGKIRNLHIRRTADGRYVLGTKSSNNFSSLADMVKHHKEVPVEVLPQESTPIKPQLYKILLRETPPKLQKLFAVV